MLEISEVTGSAFDLKSESKTKHCGVIKKWNPF
jgi:hypothetical protein